jgi:hypothetical protein
MFDPHRPWTIAASYILIVLLFASLIAADSSLNDLWNGEADLGDPELVKFTGNPQNHSLEDVGRIALVNLDNNTVYAYFRQMITVEPMVFEIYMAVSNDGGITFQVIPTPIISPQNVGGLGTVNTAYDPSVLRLSGGYYMVFEGTGAGCAFSSFIAYSPDGINNWRIKGVPVCSLTWGKSASTPNLVKTPSGDLYINWVKVDEAAYYTSRHQAKLEVSDLYKTITTNLDTGLFPMPPPGSWNGNNTGAGNVFYEGPYYYLFFEGANTFGCLNGRWGIGIARTNNMSSADSWETHPHNPFIYSPLNSTCWMGYPEITKIGDDYYLYYTDGLPYWRPTQHTKIIFRRKIQEKREGNHAQYVGQSISTTMVAGLNYSASVTMKNTGTTNWTEVGMYRLGSQNPQDNTIWGDGRVRLASLESVGPYCSSWDFIESLGGSIKSEPSVQSLESRLVFVAQGADDGVWAKEWMPGIGTVVDWYQVNGGMTNARPKLIIEKGILWLYVNGTGGQTYRTQWRWHGSWEPWTNLGAYDYGVAGPDYAAGYRAYKQGSSLLLGTCTDAASTKTFTFNVTAPISPGSYDFQWRMVQDAVEWFGEYTPNIAVLVVTTTTTTTTTTTSSTTSTTTTTTTSTSSTTTSTTSTTSSSSTTSTTVPECVMPGNTYPCNLVELSEVVAAINRWAAGSVDLGNVVDLINSWADPLFFPPQ